MKDESIKIEIQDENSHENKNIENVEEDKDMENVNKTVVNDFNDEKLVNIGVENDEMDLIFILDKSGSMYGSERDTINGFNSFIEKQLNKDRKINVTTILFNGDYDVLYSRIPVRDVKPLSSDDYYVGGSTALLDAIGKTVTTYEREINNKTLCVITTDGLENTSREYSTEQIRKMIENTGWEFIFIGADIDSYAEASRIGIKQTHTANYRKSSVGISRLYEDIDCLTDAVYCNKSIADSNWKKNLD